MIIARSVPPACAKAIQINIACAQSRNVGCLSCVLSQTSLTLAYDKTKGTYILKQMEYLAILLQ